MMPHIAQSIQRTLNNDADIDTGWILEIAIRFPDYPELSKFQFPVDGDICCLAPYRCGGKTSDQCGQWSSAVGEKPSLHRPDYFANLFFAVKQVR